jgi:hypothetical protein
VKTDYYKDTLIDWIMLILSISTMRVIVVLPDDVSVQSYKLGIKNTLTFQSTMPELFEGLVDCFYDTTYDLSVKPNTKIILMSCKTVTRLFSASKHRLLDEVDIALVPYTD